MKTTTMQDLMKVLLTDKSARNADGAAQAILKAEPFTPWDSGAAE